MDDPSFDYPSVKEVKHDISNPPGELWVSPVTPKSVPPVVYPPRRQSPQDIHFDDQLQHHNRSTPGAHLRYDNPKEVPDRAYRSSF